MIILLEGFLPTALVALPQGSNRYSCRCRAQRADQNSGQILESFLGCFLKGEGRLDSIGPKDQDPDFCFENYLQSVQSVCIADKNIF